VALWLVVGVPVFLLLLCFLVEVGNIWLARLELENSLEAAALAAVKEWGDAGGGSTHRPRDLAALYATSNTVTGTPVVMATNHNPAHAPNENDASAGDLVFGAITTTASPWVFDAQATPDLPCGATFGVRAQATVPVNSLFGQLFGLTLDTFNVSAHSTARYDPQTRQPKLIRVRAENCRG
jgi:Flp pilus assembly protein TadG